MHFTPLSRFIALALWAMVSGLSAQQRLLPSKVIPVDSGWAANSVNTVPFRKNSLITWKDEQFISFYNTEGNVVVGKRKINQRGWEIQTTNLKGNIRDAHNCISLMVDAGGYLHLAWDHHNNKLNYARSRAPGVMEFETASMVGPNEERVTYPEFHRLHNDQLLFLYRDGGSGQGNLVMNRYDVRSKTWTRLHDVLIDGEGQRNAYWQAFVDDKGVVHLSWVWRESPDVASNHDLCYARSRDGGKTWEKLNGDQYKIPINATSAEYAVIIPMNSELINQTSMAADEAGNPYIASYWRASPQDVPQYKIVFSDKGRWIVRDLKTRQADFKLSGGGTKRIPIARPQIAVSGRDNSAHAFILFRDEERGSKLSLLSWARESDKLDVYDFGMTNLGQWEPSYDTELWRKRKRLDVFVQAVNQVDAEGISENKSSPIHVVEIDCSD